MQSKLKIKIQIALLAAVLVISGMIVSFTLFGLLFHDWFTKEAHLPSDFLLILFFFNGVAAMTISIVYIFDLAEMKAKNEMDYIIQKESERKAKKLFDDIAKKVFSDLN